MHFSQSLIYEGTMPTDDGILESDLHTTLCNGAVHISE